MPICFFYPFSAQREIKGSDINEKFIRVLKGMHSFN